MFTREEDALGKFRSVYGAAGSQPEACQAFYRQGSARLIDDQGDDRNSGGTHLPETVVAHNFAPVLSLAAAVSPCADDLP